MPKRVAIIYCTDCPHRRQRRENTKEGRLWVLRCTARPKYPKVKQHERRPWITYRVRIPEWCPLPDESGGGTQ